MKINLYIPSSRKWAHQQTVSKTSRALSDLSNKKTEVDRYKKAYGPKDGTWNGSHSTAMSSFSNIFSNLDENWALKERSSPSAFFSDSKIHDYEKDDKENEHVRSVEKSLNDWEGTLDNLNATDGDKMQSNQIDFGLIGKIRKYSYL